MSSLRSTKVISCALVLGANAFQIAPVRAYTSHNTLREIRQVRLLDRAAALTGIPVDLYGVVTYHDFGRGSLFVEDPTGGVWLKWNREEFHKGDRVEITGVTGLGFTPLVVASRISRLGSGPEL